MPLTALQRDVAELLAPNRTPDSYLAGGAALHLAPDSRRYSNDLDYFQDSEARVASAFQQDRETPERAGYELSVHLQRTGFVRALVRKESASTKVEWVRRRGKYLVEDFARLHLDKTPDLLELKGCWLAALEDADERVRSWPPDQAGCLY